jgi:hypothetical protein
MFATADLLVDHYVHELWLHITVRLASQTLFGPAGPHSYSKARHFNSFALVFVLLLTMGSISWSVHAASIISFVAYPVTEKGERDRSSGHESRLTIDQCFRAWDYGSKQHAIMHLE